MTLVNHDRTRQTSTTLGTGAYALTGNVAGFERFIDTIGDGNTCWYFVTCGDEWESGLGTIAAGSPPTLTRTAVYASSNNDAAVNWPAGTKIISNGWTAKAATEAAAASGLITDSTLAAISAIGNAVNTTGKTRNKLVALADDRVYRALGPAAADKWRPQDDQSGFNDITPA